MNQCLTAFKDGWNNHGIRIEHSLTALDFFEQVPDSTGVDLEDGLVGDDSDIERVPIPQVFFQLTDEHLEFLKHNVNPLDDSVNHGIELYERTLHFIYNIVAEHQDIYN